MRRGFNGWATLSCVVLLAALVSISSQGQQIAGNESPTNAYVDSQVCAQCHTDIARTFARTGMARSFYAPTAESFPDPQPYFHAKSGTWYEVVSRDGDWYQRWWQVGFDGREASVGESKIDYVMGSGNNVRTYLHRTPRGTLTELPLGWYSDPAVGWALNPGYEVSDPPTDRKIGYDCMFCHNAYPTIPSGHEPARSEPVYTGKLPEGIECQRCHGPGGNHVATAGRPGAAGLDIQAAIVNPARLDGERSMEVCMQCHLQTTSAPLPSVIQRYDRGPFSYRPGEPLSDFQLRFDHAPGSGREDKFEIVSSVYRLRQSKCFLESGGKLGCATCHDPHNIEHGQAGIDGYNAKCVGCHPASQIAAANHSAAAASPGDSAASSNCVSCHMPKRRTDDVVHVVMTDHLIQREPASSNLLAEIPEKSLAEAEYRGEVVPYGDQDDLYTAIAQVANSSNLEDGIGRLQAEIEKQNPQQPEVYLELGDALQKAGRPEESAAAYRVALEKRPGSALLWARLAMPLRAMEQNPEALEAMWTAVKADPNDAENWYNLGLLQSGLGDKVSAIDSFRRSTELDPEFAGSRRSLGITLAETGQVEQAETELRAALRLRPTLSAAHGYLAFLLANRAAFDEAIWHFERAEDDAKNHFNYGITLARLNRLVEARAELERSLGLDPNQPVAHQVVGNLLESEGQVELAMAHYNDAIRLQPTFGRAHLDLGAALARRGDLERAAEEFRAAQSDPNPAIRQAASEALASLEGR